MPNTLPVIFFYAFFFLMIRRPPRSPLFPSTTLFRSDPRGRDPRASSSPGHPSASGHRGCRSEEHTSELQSHNDLVCRLLLEKTYTCGRSCLFLSQCGTFGRVTRSCWS